MTGTETNGKIVDLQAVRKRKNHENQITMFIPIFRDQVAHHGPDLVLYDVVQQDVILGTQDADQVGLTHESLNPNGPEMAMRHEDTETFWADLIARRGLGERVLPTTDPETLDWEQYNRRVNEILHDQYYRVSHFYYICMNGISINSLGRLNRFLPIALGMRLMTLDDAFGVEGILSTMSLFITEGGFDDFETMARTIRLKIKIGEIERQIPGNLMDEEDFELLDHLKEKQVQLDAMEDEEEGAPPVFTSISNGTEPPDQSA